MVTEAVPAKGRREYALWNIQLLPPTLQPKQREDGTWCAEASWPDAPAEGVGYFKAASDAQDSIIHEANEYFRRRAGL